MHKSIKNFRIRNLDVIDHIKKNDLSTKDNKNIYRCKGKYRDENEEDFDDDYDLP